MDLCRYGGLVFGECSIPGYWIVETSTKSPSTISLSKELMLCGVPAPYLSREPEVWPPRLLSLGVEEEERCLPEAWSSGEEMGMLPDSGETERVRRSGESAT
jgi:hypothetical protein